MIGRRLRFAAVLSLAVTVCGPIAPVFATELTIDGVRVPEPLFRAYAESGRHRAALCSADTEPARLAAFVRMLLEAREFERVRTRNLEGELYSMRLEHRRLTALRDAQPQGDRIGAVYESVRERTVGRTRAAREAYGAETKRGSRRVRPDDLNLPEDTSGEVRALLARYESLSAAYRSGILDRVSDADVARRYDAMVETRDPRLVDVHLVRSIDVRSIRTSPAIVAHLRDRLNEGATADELRAVGDLPMPASFGEPRWRRFESLDLPDVDPAEVRRGDVLVSRMRTPDRGFRHVLILDRRLASRLPLDAAAGAEGASGRPLALRRERLVRLDRDYGALRRRHSVAFQGVRLDGGDYPTECGE